MKRRHFVFSGIPALLALRRSAVAEDFNRDAVDWRILRVAYQMNAGALTAVSQTGDWQAANQEVLFASYMGTIQQLRTGGLDYVMNRYVWNGEQPPWGLPPEIAGSALLQSALVWGEEQRDWGLSAIHAMGWDTFHAAAASVFLKLYQLQSGDNSPEDVRALAADDEPVYKCIVAPLLCWPPVPPPFPPIIGEPDPLGGLTVGVDIPWYDPYNLWAPKVLKGITKEDLCAYSGAALFYLSWTLRAMAVGGALNAVVPEAAVTLGLALAVAAAARVILC